MGGSLTTEVHNKLNPLAPDDWSRMFPGSPEPPEIVRLFRQASGEAARFHSIVVRDGERPVLLLPLVAAAAGPAGALGRLAARLERLLPGEVRAVLRAAALRGGRSGLVGSDPEADAATVEAARALAAQAYEALAAVMPLQMVAPEQLQGETSKAMPAENPA